jgi:ATP-dependent 26S proteasome regulatory subunit
LVSESEGLSGGDILNIVVNAASMALEREGPDCIVVVDDFQTAINAVKRAKEEIGQPVLLQKIVDERSKRSFIT